MNKRLKGSLILLLTAVIWGFGFAAQSAGGAIIGAVPFNTLRLLTATVGLFPVTVISVKRRYGGLPPRHVLKRTLIGGAFTGVILAVATCVQQFGVDLTGSAGKSGFITSLYIIILPFIGLAVGKRPAWSVWPCAAVAAVGLWLICGGGDFGSFGLGEALLVLCAVLYAVQITGVDMTLTPEIDGILLSFVQFAVSAAVCCIPLAFTGLPSAQGLKDALPSLLYSGLMSGAAGFTLQILGQRDCPPTAAGLIMSLESVFSAFGGWILLGQKLSGIELCGCAILFAAVSAAQIPVKTNNKTNRNNTSKGERVQ